MHSIVVLGLSPLLRDRRKRVPVKILKERRAPALRSRHASGGNRYSGLIPNRVTSSLVAAISVASRFASSAGVPATIS